MEFIKCLGVKSCRNVRWPLMLSMVTIFHGLALGDERGHVYDSWQFKDHRTQINLTSLAIQNHHHGIVIGNIYPDHMSWTQALRPSSGRYNKVLWEIQENVYNMSWHEIGSGRLSKPLRANFTTDGVALYYILKWSVRNLVVRGHSAKPMQAGNSRNLGMLQPLISSRSRTTNASCSCAVMTLSSRIGSRLTLVVFGSLPILSVV